MPTNRRSLSGAALGALILGLTGAAALAQESNTVGPPALKDFQLPGQRTTPPAPTPPQPLPKAEQPARPAPAPPATVERRPEPRAAEPKAATPRAERPAAAAPAAAPPAAGPAPVPGFVLPEPRQGPAPLPSAEAPAPTPAPGWNPLWLALPVVLALLGLAAFLRSRRRPLGAGPMAREASAATPAPSPGPAPSRTPVAEPEPAVAPGPRARLEIDFLAVRAAATDNEAAVHYDLVLRNSGEAPAGNIRIDTRMFNAGDERGIRAFLDGPIHDESGSPHIFVPPGGEMRLSSAIALPRAELREIELQGRRVFVPVVAVNVAYDWAGGGRGRTSLSWLVGREPETPSAKMGPFRLDLGPRIYRSVGQRPTRLANVA